MKPQSMPAGTEAPYNKPVNQPWWHGVAVVPKASSVSAKTGLPTEWHVLVFTSGKIGGAVLPSPLFTNIAGDFAIMHS